MTVIGELSLWVALLMAAWSTIVSFAGGLQGREDLIASGRRGQYATCVFTALAFIGLWNALVAHDFSYTFVALHSSANLSPLFAGMALWSGEAGRLLLWTLLLALCSSAMVFSARRTTYGDVALVTGTLSVVSLCCLAAMCFIVNPYARLDWIPPDGRGLEPQLQQLGRAVHTPLRFLGMVATTVPFALAAGNLGSRNANPERLIALRRWTLFSWLVLTISLLLGMRCAYGEPGEVGAWALDGVNNASIVPWLSSASLLHSLLLEEQRGVLRRWNTVLVVLTFVFSVLGAFVTGQAGSVATLAFDQSAIGPWVLGFLSVVAGGVLCLLAVRPASGAGERFEHNLSRQCVLLYSGLILTTLALVVLSATLAPRVVGAPRGTIGFLHAPIVVATVGVGGVLWLLCATLGPMVAWQMTPWITIRRQLAAPSLLGTTLLLVLLALGVRDLRVLVTCVLGAAVVAASIQDVVVGARARQRLSGDAFVAAFGGLLSRDRARFGGYMVHAGVVAVCVAFAAMGGATELSANVRVGETITADDAFGHRWTFTSQGVSRFSQPDRQVVAIALRATRDGKPVGMFSSEQRQYLDGRGEFVFAPWSDVGVISVPWIDALMTLTDVGGSDRAAVLIRFNPFVRFVWFGGLLMVFGGMFAIWPSPRNASMQP